MIQKKRLVIFDLDNTILNGDSDYSMVNYLIRKNILPESATEIKSKSAINNCPTPPEVYKSCIARVCR